MLRANPNILPLRSDLQTVWGLDPIQLHDRFWASRSVCVVRPGGAAPLPRGVELYMLTDARTLSVFRLRHLVEKLFWARPAVVFVRLHFRADRRYREHVATDADGRFVRLARHYGDGRRQVARIALTRDRRVAELWAATDGSPAAWRTFRRQTRGRRRQTLVTEGRHYDRFDAGQLNTLVGDLVRQWHNPSTAIEGIRQVADGVWAPRDASPDATLCFLGPAWIGAGRIVPSGGSVLGPAVLWDDGAARPDATSMRWDRLDPTLLTRRRPALRPQTPWRRRTKRAFDVAFAVGVLAVTLPLYPLIMLAIWLEDGRPFLFGHRRETAGGREFACLKFRSMRKDADRIKQQLLAKNQSDGPQFFMADDPRVTRVGRFLRKTNLDELPQFINVLLGHMSVVGPRPSPRAENQCCPAWREARLSVRPGVTGLWQVMRTRREGLDFQEWIRFDVEYVERASWRLDLWIIWRTLRLLIGKS